MTRGETARHLANNLHVRRLAGMAVVTIGLCWLGAFAFSKLAPPQDNPFTRLDLDLPPGIATGMKLDRLAQSPAKCFAALDRVAIGYTPVDRKDPAYRKGGGGNCELRDALTLDKSLTPYSATLTMSCPLTASLYVWERHVVLPAAERILKSKIVRIETYGSWSCRRVNHAKDGKWSNHATGNAVDIAGFTLADGRRVMIKDKFRDKGPEGQFLREVRDKGCDLFSATLSPDYNAAHADHLHFDMGLYTICS